MPLFDKASLAKYVENNPPPAPEKKKGIGWGTRSAIYGGAGADALSTIEALKHSGLSEGNPLYGKNPSPARVVVTKGLQALGQDLLLQKLADAGHDKWAKGLGIGFGALGIGNAVNNMIQIKKAKGK